MNSTGTRRKAREHIGNPKKTKKDPGDPTNTSEILRKLMNLKTPNDPPEKKKQITKAKENKTHLRKSRHAFQTT